MYHTSASSHTSPPAQMNAGLHTPGIFHPYTHPYMQISPPTAFTPTNSPPGHTTTLHVSPPTLYAPTDAPPVHTLSLPSYGMQPAPWQPHPSAISCMSHFPTTYKTESAWAQYASQTITSTFSVIPPPPAQIVCPTNAAAAAAAEVYAEATQQRTPSSQSGPCTYTSPDMTDWNRFNYSCPQGNTSGYDPGT